MRSHARHALSLMELVLAIALSAMLMAALVGVLRVSQREASRLKNSDSDAWRADVRKVLYRDLQRASTIKEVEDTIRLGGRFDRATSNDADLPCREVRYECSAGFLEGQRVLMRVTEKGGEPVAFGVTRLKVERVDAYGLPQPISHAATPAPEHVRIWIWRAGNDDAEADAMFDLVIR